MNGTLAQINSRFIGLALPPENEHLLLCRQPPVAALNRLEPILVHLQSHTLFYIEEGFHIFLFGCRILAANRDERTAAFLQTTYQRLQARAATIDGPKEQRIFWAAMPGHREILAAIQV